MLGKAREEGMGSEKRQMKNAYLFTAIVLVLAALAASLAVYSSLPERVPTHWNFRGNVNHYGSKITVFILPGMMALCVPLFFWVFPWISPRRFEVETFRS